MVHTVDTIQILLVEDEAIIAMARAQSLTAMGFTVHTAHSGEAAVRHALEDTSLDIILMDIDLGRGIDGVEAATQILADHHVPIVFLSSHSESEVVERVRTVTRYGYILKNSSDFTVRQTIETALELDRMYRESLEHRDELHRHVTRLEKVERELRLREEHLTRSNRALRILERLKRNTATADTVSALLRGFCRIVTEDGIYPLVTVSALTVKPEPGLLQVATSEETAEPISGVPTAGAVAGDATATGDLIPCVELGLLVARIATPAIVTDIAADPRVAECRDIALSRGYRSLVVFPVRRGDTMWGICTVFGATPDVFEDQEVELLHEIVHELSFGIESIHVRDDRGAVRELLLKERRELRERVKELHCLHLVGEIAETPDISVDELLRRVVPAIPPAFHDPSATTIEVSLRGLTYRAGALADEPVDGWDLVVPVTVDQEYAGEIRVIVSGEETASYLPRRRLKMKGESPVLPEERKLLGTISSRIGRITERIEALQREREIERRLSLILEGSRIGSWSWYVPSGAVEIDARWAEMLGYLDHELQPMTRKRWADLCHQEDWQAAGRRMADHLQGASEYFSAELRMRHKVGDWRWVFAKGQVLERDAVGKPVRMMGTLTDITEVKEEERDLRQDAEEHDVAIHRRDLLMREMHHRVKNDLNLIRSLFSLQASSVQDRVTRRLLTEAGHRVNAIARIYENLYAGGDLQAVQVKALTESILTDLRAGVFDGEVVVESDIEDLTLPQGDSISYGIVLNELVTNALKYAQPADGPLRLGVFVRNDGDNRLALTVTDNGQGYAPEVLAGGHAGFGTMVVHALTEQAGGHIELSNDDGARATAVFRLNTPGERDRDGES
ncbi:MAG: PAS domain-containing protein [Alkalispirochaeta sp.]